MNYPFGVRDDYEERRFELRPGVWVVTHSGPALDDTAERVQMQTAFSEGLEGFIRDRKERERQEPVTGRGQVPGPGLQPRG